MSNEKMEILDDREFKSLYEKSKNLIDSARSNMGQMAEVFQEVMLRECDSFIWLIGKEKMKLSNRELDNLKQHIKSAI